MADSEQNKFEIFGMQDLNDSNAEYLRANQDYNYFDNWYLNADERPDAAEYYQSSFSQPLLDAIDRDLDKVWDDQYYTDMYAEADQNFEDSDVNFELGAQWDERGDKLQLVLMIMALGLAFAAWASLMKEDSNLRIFFSLFAIVTLALGLITYLGVPVVAM